MDEVKRPFFRPRAAMRPIFFLHIPKTAGSSNNAFLRHLYGAGNFQDHAENSLPGLSDGTQGPLRVDCVSGHIPLWAWHLYPGSEDYARVTLLRSPWDRVVSHINWVNMHNHGMRAPTHGKGAADLRRMIGVVAETDFNNRRSLVMLLNQVRQLRYFSSFDNYQVRMLRQGAMDAMEKTLRAADLDAAMDALSGFFHIGFAHEQAAFQQGLLAKLGVNAQPLPRKTNVGRFKALHADNDLAREVLSPWFELDQALYGFAKGYTLSQAA